MPNENGIFTLGDLQKSIDYVRENYDDWSTFPIQAEIDMGEESVLVTEFQDVFIPEEENVFVLVS